jgi:hypothetical protein
MVRRHIKRPKVLLNLDARRIHRHHEGRYPSRITGIAGGPCHHHVTVCSVNTGIPRLHTIDDPVIAIAMRHCFHMGRVRAVVWLCNSEGKTPGRIF